MWFIVKKKQEIGTDTAWKVSIDNHNKIVN